MQTFYLLAQCQASCARCVLGRVVKQGLRALVLAGTVIAALGNPSHAETISPRRLLEVVDFSPPVVSPDGSRVAFRIEQASVERNTYDTVWYVQDMDGNSKPRRLADGGVPLRDAAGVSRSEEHTSELQSIMRSWQAGLCVKKK